MATGLTIVVPAHRRVDMLVALLKSIAADAEKVGFPVEVIIVDDSPQPDAERIRKAAGDHGARVLDGVAHVGAKRNQGAANAEHELILFLDSDVKICSGTLRAHVNRLSRAPADVVACLGKVKFVGEATYPWQVIEAMQLTLPFSYPDLAEQVPWGPTAHLSIRRGAFFEVGGFDTSLPRYGGEDVDLGLRLTGRGMRIVTAREAVAEHSIETWSTWRQNLRRLWSFGLADYHLLVRHPSRGFLDFPTGPMLWLGQTIALLVMIAFGRATYTVAACALGASVVAYPVIYASLKRQSGSRFVVHLPGPFIFWTMDLAKAMESIRHGRPGLILRRLKFLDDLIAQDWREIAASAWALTASAAAFLAVLVAMIILGGPR